MTVLDVAEGGLNCDYERVREGRSEIEDRTTVEKTKTSLHGLMLSDVQFCRITIFIHYDHRSFRKLWIGIIKLSIIDLSKVGERKLVGSSVGCVYLNQPERIFGSRVPLWWKFRSSALIVDKH